MPQVLPIHIKAATEKTASMSLAQKEAEFDVVFQQQPNILASVLVQQQLGNTLEQMDVLLNILLVIHLSLKEAGVVVPTVTEAQREKQLRRLVGRINFSEGLPGKSRDESIQQMAEDSKEKWLFVYTLNELVVAGFPDLQKESSKHLILCGLNMVGCLETDG